MAETDDTGPSDTGPSDNGRFDNGVVDAVGATSRAELTPKPAKPQPGRSVVWPLLGGVLAALAGYGLAQVLPDGWPVGSSSAFQTQLAAEVEQVQALNAQVLELDQRLQQVSAIADRVAKLEAAPAPQIDASNVTALEARISTLESRPAGAGTDPAALISLRADVEAMKANGAGIVSPQMQASIDAKVQQTEAKLTAIEQSAKDQAQAVMIRAAVRQIAAALDTGAPYPSAIADLASVTLPAVLTDGAASGLPSLQSLQGGFPDAARAALEAALRVNMGQSWTERVTNFLRAQTGARSLAPREGNDPDAILSRAEAALAQGDLATALTEIAALPPEALAALADWQARAKLRLDAETAVRALMTQAG